MRLWEELGLAEEVGCQESREQKVKHFPELYNGKSRHKHKHER